MHSLTRPGRWPMVLAIAGLMVLAACGSSSKTTTSATTGASTPAAPSTTASSSGATVSTASSALGTILVDAQGFTLYHNDKESGTTIVCTATCAQIWPPLAAPSGGPVAGAGLSGLATVARPDGTKQVTYNGKTLYRYTGDSKAGDTTGEGVGGIWHAVTTGAATGTTPSSTSASGY